MDQSLTTSSYRQRQSDGIELRENVRFVIPKLFCSRTPFGLKKNNTDSYNFAHVNILPGDR